MNQKINKMGKKIIIQVCKNFREKLQNASNAYRQFEERASGRKLEDPRDLYELMELLVVDNLRSDRHNNTFRGSENIKRYLPEEIPNSENWKLINGKKGIQYVQNGNSYIYWNGRELDCYTGDYFLETAEIRENIDFDYIKDHGLLLFKYVRGSTLYGLQRPGSDIDKGGVYIEPLESLLGISEFPEEVHDETNDETWYSLRKYAKLLSGSNPNILESLFVPLDKILYINPLWSRILQNRNEFVTKKCFGSFMGYAVTQIERARGLKKKITQPMTGEMKSCLEYVFYSDNGKTKRVIDWLNYYELPQKYCGLVNLSNMEGAYSMYYDWGAFFKEHGGLSELLYNLRQDKYKNLRLELIPKLFPYNSESDLKEYEKKYSEPLGYKGLVKEEGNNSNQVRLSSIPKDEDEIMTVYYSKDAYSNYCRQWRGYHDFELHHNEERFNLAKEKQFDRKNACHSARLLNMGIEIAQGKGVLIDRTNIDRDFLMGIRMGETTYEELMEYLEEKKKEMNEAMENSTIPEEPNLELLNNLVTSLRKDFYGINSTM